MAIQEITVSKIYILATEPTKKVKDRFWFDTTNNILKRYDGTTWKPISVSSDDVAVLSDGSKISLTSYLNTQIAALAEGIDSKQDKLTFYHEETSTNQEASIVGANSFSINNTNQGLILAGNNGGITIENSTIEDQDVISIEGNSFGAGRGIISIANNIWSGDSILFNIEGTSIKISDALLIPEIKNKQNKLLCYSETIPTDKSYPEEVVITAKGQNFLAANGAGTITLLATNSTDSGDGFAPGTINLNASKVLKNGEDIATTGDLANKQNKLQTYSESAPSGGLPSAAITAEVGLSLDSKQIKIGGGIFNAETIIDGWSKGYSGTSKIKVSGSSILLQTTSSDNEGSIIELTENTLAINSDMGITGNILEKTISSSSVDTKIPTAKAVKNALDTKQNKLTYYKEVSGRTPSATISVKNIKLKGNVAEGLGSTASGDYSHAEGFGSTASGVYSHAEGQSTTASGNYSHTEGISTYASSDYQHAQGKYNIEDANDKYADIIGNGSSTSARSNAATVS